MFTALVTETSTRFVLNHFNEEKKTHYVLITLIPFSSLEIKCLKLTVSLGCCFCKFLFLFSFSFVVFF